MMINTSHFIRKFNFFFFPSIAFICIILLYHKRNVEEANFGFFATELICGFLCWFVGLLSLDAIGS